MIADKATLQFLEEHGIKKVEFTEFGWFLSFGKGVSLHLFYDEDMQENVELETEG